MNMFKSLLLCFVLLTCTQLTNAQSFTKETKLANLGIKLWSGITPISASAEFGVADNIGVGGQLWYASEGDSNYSIKYITPGVFGNYHFNIDNDKLDLYGGAGLNYFIASVSSSYVSSSASASTTFFNLQGGGRYYVSPKIGLNAQLDINMKNGTQTYLALGASLKF